MNDNLLDVVTSGDVASLQTRLDRGLHVDAVVVPHNGMTLLEMAIEHDQPGVVRLLLRAGADPNRRTRDGMTMLACAVNLEIDAEAQVGVPADGRLLVPLLHAGASVEDTNRHHESALAVAQRRGSGVLELLLRRHRQK